MTDSFFKPKTIKDCHKRIEGLLHTNKTQADELGKIKEDLAVLKQKYEEVVKANQTFARNESIKRRHLTIINTLTDRVCELGFNDAVELLWPLVETLTETKPYWMFKRDFDQAIKDLEQKLQRLCKSG